MSSAGNRELARLFSEMADLLALSGDNGFRVRSYERAARVMETLERDVSELAAEGGLGGIPGIGKGITGKVEEFLSTGRIKALDDLRASFPSGLLEMLKVPGIGPRKARLVFERLGISTLHELEEAARSGKLAELPGFGKKSSESIAEGVAFIKRNRDRFLWADAWEIARPLLEALEGQPSTIRVGAAGSIRRRMETVRNVDVVVSSTDPDETAGVFIEAAGEGRVLERGPGRVRVRGSSGMMCDLRMVPDDRFSHALLYYTGSREHNAAMRSWAEEAGFRMDEHGLFRAAPGRETLVRCRSEEEIFEVLGLQYIPPELRENTGEIKAAAARSIPGLVEEGDVLGAVHVHSDWSDGRDSLEAMAAAAEKMGFHYLVICDHSRSASYAGGLDPDRLEEQGRRIEELNAGFDGFRLLKGTECDILPDGSLDFPEETLRRLDVVVASVHSRFGLSREEQTRRIEKAVRHPCCHILGHPTGRLLLQREPYDVDLERVLTACAEAGTAVEINGDPNRLDLDWRWCRRAVELGVGIVLSCDAHVSDGLANTFLAVGCARKGWLRKEDVLNTLPAEEFLAALRDG